MKWRLGFLLCCATLIALAGATAESSPAVPWICCDGSTACPAQELCCDAESLGQDPCSEELAGLCVEKCKRVIGTANVTLDRK